ncbi:hypothetical protein [Flavobacterium sp. NRK F7]|uniref:hypothetical protein n=1 Tax=Flavobacterium sp. NRK F7 TaxID=2954930 RepID=UPI00209134CD|nr:hypothetical protein [Flavobacterium sp. NRK F7]MCO6164075.1 hypothetical protein [Flavobacterium sp. NRK F7]
MKQIVYAILFLVIISCTPKISPYFEQNHYIRNYSIHIQNDSLQLYFKTPADISYVTDTKELKKRIRNSKIKLADPVLIYGSTNDPPYEYFVTVSENKLSNYSKELVVFDTLVENQTIRFIGNALEKNAKKTLEIDLKNCFKSLEVGPTYRKQIQTIFDVVQKYQLSNKFYTALQEISDFPSYDKQEEWSKLQMQLTFSSFLGKNKLYNTYLSQLESRFKPNDTVVKTIKEKTVYNAQALDTILQEAKKHRMIMINENHFYPNHRKLVSDVLEKLKAIGYHYLALEALNTKQDSLLNVPNSYPTLETGFYTSEQNFSNLIRKAKALDFRFIAYENTDTNQDREVGQAENIYNKSFLIDPNAKVVVLAGIDHILEKPTSQGKEWMATVFKNKYQIDPLTISQTHLNAYRNEIDYNYGILNSKNFKDTRWNAVDYLVLNNNTKEPIEDPFSAYEYQNNTKTDIQIALLLGNEIKNPYDYSKKIPYFTTIVTSGKKLEVPVDLSKATYLLAFDKNGNLLDKQIIPARD